MSLRIGKVLSSKVLMIATAVVIVVTLSSIAFTVERNEWIVVYKGEVGDASNALVMWSPTSDKVAVIRSKDVYILDLGSKSLRRVLFQFSNPYAEERIIRASWSPNGKLLAVQTNWKVVLIDPSKGEGLWSLNVDPMKGFLTSFTWLPSGDGLVASVVEKGTNRSIVGRLVWLNMNGNITRDLRFNIPVYSISCSPGCKYIALASYIINVFGHVTNVSSNVMVITNNGEVVSNVSIDKCLIDGVFWSRSNDLIAFKGYCELKGQYFTSLSLGLMDLRGRMLWNYSLPYGQVATSGLLSQEVDELREIPVRWSSSNKFIAYEVGPHPSNYVLTILSVRNGEAIAQLGTYGVKELGNKTYIVASSDWNPLTNVIAIATVGGSQGGTLTSSIVLMNVTDSGVKLWLKSQEFRGYIRSIAWSPSGDRVACVIADYVTSKNLLLILNLPQGGGGLPDYIVIALIIVIVVSLTAYILVRRRKS